MREHIYTGEVRGVSRVSKEEGKGDEIGQI